MEKKETYFSIKEDAALYLLEVLFSEYEPNDFLAFFNYLVTNANKEDSILQQDFKMIAYLNAFLSSVNEEKIEREVTVRTKKD